MPLKRLEKLNTQENLWIYILRILTDKPKHAYVIRGEIGERFGFMPGTMTAYKVLYLLSKDGLVKKAQDGRKVVYSITPEGRKALEGGIEFYKRMVERLI